MYSNAIWWGVFTNFDLYSFLFYLNDACFIRISVNVLLLSLTIFLNDSAINLNSLLKNDKNRSGRITNVVINENNDSNKTNDAVFATFMAVPCYEGEIVTYLILRALCHVGMRS